MAVDPDWRDHVRDIAPGVVGAFVALAWIEGTPWRLAASLLGGGGAAYYGAPTVAEYLSVSQSLCGFLIGLFGMAIAARIFEAISAIPIRRIIDNFLERWGL